MQVRGAGVPVVPESRPGALCKLWRAGAWNKRYGLLFIDQPVGTGFSTACAPYCCGLYRCMPAITNTPLPQGKDAVLTPLLLAATKDVPTDEMLIASDLYAAINAFYIRKEEFQTRPLFITGESYGGKYVKIWEHPCCTSDTRLSQCRLSP